MIRAIRRFLPCLSLLSCAGACLSQIDPAKRELIQLGYNQPMQGHAPLAGYAFYYLNLPNFYRSNITMRLAIAPVYVDSEFGFSEALGPNTDVGIGLFGGGFANSYSEIRQGKYLQDESFLGHGGGISGSIYHRFNPAQQIPLYGVLRTESHYLLYERDNDTASGFDIPDDQTAFSFRTGLRWGGREPLVQPDVAMELSAWYEAQIRTSPGDYGFNGDRRLRLDTHLFWARALLAYKFPKLKHHFYVNLTGGTSLNADRFSAYRLGGLLPLAAEFPLSLPGYYFQEISARRFVLLGANYSIPLDPNDNWAFNVVAATAGVDYLPGLEQSGHWHSGVGAGFSFRSPSSAWQVSVGYAYGIDAIRNGDRGAHAVGFVLQFDLERARLGLFEPGENPIRSRGLQRLFGVP